MSESFFPVGWRHKDYNNESFPQPLRNIYYHSCIDDTIISLKSLQPCVYGLQHEFVTNFLIWCRYITSLLYRASRVYTVASNNKACINQLLSLAVSSLWHIKGTARKTLTHCIMLEYIIVLEYLLQYIQYIHSHHIHMHTCVIRYWNT